MKPALSEKDQAYPSEWQQFRQGEALNQAIVSALQPWWQKIFGYYLLKIGDLSCQLDTSGCKVQHHITVGRSSAGLMLQAEADALPFCDNSVDAVLLSHNLEFTPDPHHVVREGLAAGIDEERLVPEAQPSPWTQLARQRWRRPTPCDAGVGRTSRNRVRDPRRQPERQSGQHQCRSSATHG